MLTLMGQKGAQMPWNHVMIPTLSESLNITNDSMSEQSVNFDNNNYVARYGRVVKSRTIFDPSNM